MARMNWTKVNQQAAMQRYGWEALESYGSTADYPDRFKSKKRPPRRSKAETHKFGQKDWMRSDAGRSLQAYVGSRGYRTSTLEGSTDLIRTAAAMFDLPCAPNLEEMVDAVAALSPAQRRERAEAFMAGHDDD